MTTVTHRTVEIVEMLPQLESRWGAMIEGKWYVQLYLYHPIPHDTTTTSGSRKPTTSVSRAAEASNRDNQREGDCATKLTLDDRYQIAEDWIVDRQAMTANVFRHDDEALRHVATLQSGDGRNFLLTPGFFCKLKRFGAI